MIIKNEMTCLSIFIGKETSLDAYDRIFSIEFMLIFFH